jgi:hypothetical protein
MATGGTIPMERADELLRQMTVEEKAMQLSAVFPLELFNTEGPDRTAASSTPCSETALGMFSALGLIRAQDARGARQGDQRHPALPGHRDAAQDSRDLLQRSDCIRP